jgi:hypothetical protein
MAGFSAKKSDVTLSSSPDIEPTLLGTTLPTVGRRGYLRQRMGHLIRINQCLRQRVATLLEHGDAVQDSGPQRDLERGERLALWSRTMATPSAPSAKEKVRQPPEQSAPRDPLLAHADSGVGVSSRGTATVLSRPSKLLEDEGRAPRPTADIEAEYIAKAAVPSPFRMVTKNRGLNDCKLMVAQECLRIQLSETVGDSNLVEVPLRSIIEVTLGQSSSDFASLLIAGQGEGRGPTFEEFGSAYYRSFSIVALDLDELRLNVDLDSPLYKVFLGEGTSVSGALDPPPIGLDSLKEGNVLQRYSFIASDSAAFDVFVTALDCLWYGGSPSFKQPVDFRQFQSTSLGKMLRGEELLFCEQEHISPTHYLKLKRYLFSSETLPCGMTNFSALLQAMSQERSTSTQNSSQSNSLVSDLGVFRLRRILQYWEHRQWIRMHQVFKVEDVVAVS